MLCDFKKRMRVNPPPWPMLSGGILNSRMKRERVLACCHQPLVSQGYMNCRGPKGGCQMWLSQSSGKDLTTKSFLLEEVDA